MSESTSTPRRILVVDDEELVLFAIAQGLTNHGYAVETADNCASASALARTAVFDYVLVDMVLPDGSGIDLLRQIKSGDPALPVVVMTAYGSLEKAVDAMKSGADDFIQKPFDIAYLLLVLGRVEQMNRCRAENLRLRLDREREIQQQELDQRKLRFFRFASHELKAPLVAVQSSLKVIDEICGERLEPRVLDLIRRAVGRSDQMMQMINDMLAISVDESSQRTTYTCVDVVAIVREVAAEQEISARLKPLELLLDIPVSVAFATCNRASMEKVVANLLTNAIRYTPAGGRVVVRVYVQPPVVKVEVEDTGIGIAEEDRARIFDEFFRAANARKAVAIGTGLGLALVRKVVEEHGGEVMVSSRLQQGSTFTITIPIGECNAFG